ncbi:MAG: cytochrome P450 [Pseudomonadota bacterium]|nr:cytochrome P450 [Pseudomonadota bacterium]
MSFLLNLIRVPARFVGVLWGGLVDLFRLLGLVVSSLSGDQGTVKSRIAGRLTSTQGQLLVFGVLRVFRANLVIGKSLVKAYENKGTAIVTRFADVKEVLDREADFAVVYEPRMRRITAGDNFFLGMQNSPAYQHNVSVMRLAARWEDVDQIVSPFIEQRAAAVVASSDGRIDVPAQLTLPVIAQMVGRYFGTPGPSEGDMIQWTSLMFWYLFIDLGADPEVDRKTLAAAAACREYLDRTIADRKANPTSDDDVLNRCLDLQRAGTLGFDDLAIRNNLIGLVIGAIPTISRAAVQALDQLLDRPAMLRKAQEAARGNDVETLGRYCFESLRFNPINPVIYRRALRDCTIADGTLRARLIPGGSMVFAANLSAMFDAWELNSPRSFRIDRPWEHYMLWGYGLHTCFGQHINRAAIPLVLRPLLAGGELHRADGAAGRIDTEGMPFPAHLWLEIDRG